LIPQLPLCKAHYVFLCDLSHYSLNLLWTHAATGCDDLSSDIFRYGSGAVEGEEDGCLELGFGTFDFSFGDVVWQAWPFAEGEVNKIIDTSELVSDKIDTP
jgi:hypothetical protein